MIQNKTRIFFKILQLSFERYAIPLCIILCSFWKRINENVKKNRYENAHFRKNSIFKEDWIDIVKNKCIKFDSILSITSCTFWRYAVDIRIHGHIGTLTHKHKEIQSCGQSDTQTYRHMDIWTSVHIAIRIYRSIYMRKDKHTFCENMFCKIFDT